MGLYCNIVGSHQAPSVANINSPKKKYIYKYICYETKHQYFYSIINSENSLLLPALWPARK